MRQDIERLKQEFEHDWQSANNAQEIETLRVKYLGRKAFLNELFARIVQMPILERGNWGKELNQLKQYPKGKARSIPIKQLFAKLKNPETNHNKEMAEA